ncbi:MAG: DivIVA domain-containing protein [Malacoplasma sp.]|nr:DivIVA domain-containing protein [Malacoplasma sp.]
MNYDFDKEINKILDKVFKKAISTGYDADEVDAFFDEVIDYIKQVRELQKSLSAKLEAKDQEIIKLNSKIQQDEEKCKKLEKIIEEYKDNGYSNTRNSNN